MSDLEVKTKVSVLTAANADTADLLVPPVRLSAECFGLTDRGQCRSKNED